MYLLLRTLLVIPLGREWALLVRFRSQTPARTEKMKRLLIRYLRIAGWLVFTVVVFMVLIEFTFYLTDVFAQRKAESLLQDVRNLRVGASTEDDVQRIVKRYGHETHQGFGITTWSGC